MSAQQPTLFQSFNARFSDSETVGERFVPSPFMHAVASPNNTAILGPRGSGKTTLLKMLTLPALKKWNALGRDDLAKDIEFLAVYIPANLTWSASYRSFAFTQMREDTDSLLSTALFRHYALVSLVQTWSDASNDAIQTDPTLKRFFLGEAASEVSQIRRLAASWGIEAETSTRSGLRSALKARIRLLQQLTVECALRGTSALELVNKFPFLTGHFFDDAEEFADFVQGWLGPSIKIALCFDELEIAADSVATTVLKAPRSVDQRLLIKYSAAPYVAAALGSQDPNVPSEQNDFTLIFLSSYSVGQTKSFSQALFNSLVKPVIGDVSPIAVFGKSFLDEERSYDKGGSRAKKFDSLLKGDDTFRAYAKTHGLSDINLSEGTENRRAADIRKILWPVLIREEFLFYAERASNQHRRTRRLRSKDLVSDIYTGAESLFALCEGNPRWIMGLMTPLVGKFESDAERRVVRRSDQKKAIARMMEAFFALLSTIPNSSQDGQVRSLLELVDRIGFYFRLSVLGKKFNADPVLSFYVDDAVSAQVADLVGRGMNIGAFVTRTDSDEQPYRVGEISGLRVRLSHIFAPRYRLPLVAGREISLSTILREPQTVKQGSLFDLFGEQ